MFFVCPYFVFTTADTYAHLDAHSKRGSASVIENALAITA